MLDDKEEAMADDCYRELDEKEEKKFRRWARDNHVSGDPIKPVWHPVVRNECFIIDNESI